MHRMMFEDIKLMMPDAEIHFACPKMYHDAVKDHPFIDKLVASEEIDHREYIAHYNTTTICGRIEMQLAPKISPHRTDIWSNHCGYVCKTHDMHIHLSEQEKKEAKEKLESNRDKNGPIALITPISAMKNKNLLPHQLISTVDYLRKQGLCVIGLHNTPIPELEENKVPSICSLGNLRLWMSIINEASYTISVDTAAFHCSGGLKKPTLGIFTFVNGLAYGKYYPKVEILQGPCPLLFQGCYDWSICPTKPNPKPCITNLTIDMINTSIDNLLKKFPIH